MTLKNIFKGEEKQQQRILDSPDERFMACCQARQLPDACLNKCSFATFTRQSLQVKTFLDQIIKFDILLFSEYVFSNGFVPNAGKSERKINLIFILLHLLIIS
jgi:hypothetical protein